MNNTPLLRAMISYDKDDPKRIQHFLKVYEFTHLICDGEQVDTMIRQTAETAAIVHDIGIHLSEQKYGSSGGKYQEQEGPAEARKMLSGLYYADNIIDRVCWLVGHHHTYTNINAADYQILVEADFLVNLYEDFPEAAVRRDAAEAAYRNIFRTETGKQLFKELFGN
ncbi:MAG TPA: phosphohydrolase [Treponema sp.]|nr:phosphohydrolase [Treponema sp.]